MKYYTVYGGSCLPIFQGSLFGPIFKGQAVKKECLTPEKGPDRLSWNISKQVSTRTA
jgi:hypothetical protein